MLRRRTRRIKRCVAHERIEGSCGDRSRTPARYVVLFALLRLGARREWRDSSPVRLLKDNSRDDVAIACGHYVGSFEARPPLRICQLCRDIAREQRGTQGVLPYERLQAVNASESVCFARLQK